MTYRTASAVLFVIFNRPDTTARVFECIRQAQPPRLYVAADGPRPGRPDEPERCRRTRDIVAQVDWDCQVFTLFREENLGCKYAVSSAIQWFFEHEPEGVVLEDDCLPHASFFRFCDELLERYRDDNRVMAVCGANFQKGLWHPAESYYFSRYNHVWGWASWRRAWNGYDAEMADWSAFVDAAGLEKLFPANWPARIFWKRMLDAVAAGAIDTWDYQWLYAIWRQGGVSILPARNLVKNIGFTEDATHTRHAEQWLLEMTAEAMSFPLWHPAAVSSCTEADTRYERTVLHIRPLRMARKHLKFLVRTAVTRLFPSGR